jgi:RimJ/RimL family protein N-acetyltransferase
LAPRRGIPLRTERLTVRRFTRDDITRFTAYRNLPAVWTYQDWTVPYTRDHAHDLLDELESLRGPTPGAWVQLALDDGTGLVGDIAVWISPDGGLGMIGYTLDPAVQGRGYATEAVGAVVGLLFDRYRVHRVAATLDPANTPSARVLERLGFRYEGRSVRAALVRGRWEDDDRYAVLDDEYRAWCDRPRHAPAMVELVEVTADNVRSVLALETHPSQRRFVASVAESLADALVPPIEHGAPVVPWYRAVAADGELAGFVMLAAASPAQPVPMLWRLLIDRRHQGRGIGATVIERVAEHVRALGATRLHTSWEEGPGGPAGFYERLGFVRTGEVIDGETVGELRLSSPDR